MNRSQHISSIASYNLNGRKKRIVEIHSGLTPQNMTLKEMDGLIVHAQHENGFWDCCTIQVGDWINIMDPPFKKYAYLITHTGIKTNTSVTAAENKTSEPLISSVDKVNPVPVSPPVFSENNVD